MEITDKLDINTVIEPYIGENEDPENSENSEGEEQRESSA
jgi:hypothetical protein